MSRTVGELCDEAERKGHRHEDSPWTCFCDTPEAPPKVRRGWLLDWYEQIEREVWGRRPSRTSPSEGSSSDSAEPGESECPK